MRYHSRHALDLLRSGTGRPDVEFREGQEHAIRHVVEGRGRLLVVQKTGWGKSLVYFTATKLLRESGAGPALLISPLLALMRNQIAAAERRGIHAVRITSDNREHWEDVEERLQRNEVDLLLISPERLGNERFRDEVLVDIAERITLLVIDEAHCISDWGHDFRPHYRLIERIARTLPRNLRLLATTATANNRVMDDLRAVLGPDLEVSRGDLSRPSLLLQTIRLPRPLPKTLPRRWHGAPSPSCARPAPERFRKSSRETAREATRGPTDAPSVAFPPSRHTRPLTRIGRLFFL